MTSQPVPVAAPHTLPGSPWYERLSWLFVLVVGVLAYIVVFVVMLLTHNTTLLPTVLLVGAGTVPLTVLLAAQTTRRGILVPIPIVLLTVGVGGLLAVTIAGFLETIAALILGQESILLVGIIEETAKLIVPLLVLAIAHRATRGGGIAVGIAAGTGFAVLETMGYGFNALLERGGGLAALDSTLVLRAILVPAGHVAWTGAICAAVWHLVEGRRKGLAVLELALTYVVAIVLHTAWDATSSAVLHVLIGVVSVGALVFLILRAHRTHVRALEGAPGDPR
ncbi:PrsW family intramembrane metalloprotease [Brachybacterium kimchii]|uniref:PrsW family intramembrane metalloprotease n=1 Tax=Brachybacterium kimchii TaxID=2942909 RepID=A0ABY4N6G9_9MICO|nr:PrsW family intramembrane metalloprotease [Brachybacterium kimchii]UQN30150.1 PrsW family intramembrane metalloprotease [Brachybacterium kimchii]